MNTISASEALHMLKDGNQRFIKSKTQKYNRDINRVREISEGQHPFAIILTCSDSRVSPEIIFDYGLGDFFEIEIAGNIIDDAVLGSIEFAVMHLSVNLILVLGHTKCGAITAATREGNEFGYISSLVNTIKPSYRKAKNLEGDIVQNTMICNVNESVHKIKKYSILADERYLDNREILVQGAYYDLDSGEVILIKE